jgi:hypothetical protein
MRNILYGFILGVALLHWVPVAQAQPDTLWSSRVILDGTVTLNGAVGITDGFVVVGSSITQAGNRDMIVAKVSLSGDVLWTNTMGTTRDEEAWGVASTTTGNFIIAGFGVDQTGSRNRLVVAGVNANGDSVFWRTYASNGQTKGRDIVRLSDNNFGVIGYRYSDQNSSSDMWLLKCNANGDTLWSRTYGGAQTDVGNRLALRPNGGLAIAGTTMSSGNGANDAWIVVTDSLGQNSVSHTFGTTSNEYGNAVSASESGEIFVGGRGALSDGPAFVAKCNSSGGVIWSNFYVEESSAMVRGFIARTGGGVFCVGMDTDSGGRPWMMGLDADGNHEWGQRLNLPGGELNGIVPVPNGEALAFGTASAEGYVLLFATPAGIGGIMHEVASGLPIAGVYVSTLGNGYAAITDVEGRFTLERSPGTYTLVGYGPCVERDTFQTVEAFEDSIVAVELSIGVPDYQRVQSSVNITVHNHQSASEPLYLQNIGSGIMSFEITAEAYSPPTPWLTVEPETGWVPAGETVTVQVIAQPDTTDDGVYDFYGYLSLRTNSCPDSTDQLPVLVNVLDANDQASLPREFALHAAYPNPFNPQTTIVFDLPRAADVRLAIYDITGRLVRELVQGPRAAGVHGLVFDASDLASGVYVARFESSDFHAVQKLLLLR